MICAAFAQMEKELIAERVKAGLESGKKKGKKGRHPKALTDKKKKKLKSLLETNKFSVSQICEMAGISRSVYYRSISNE